MRKICCIIAGLVLSTQASAQVFSFTRDEMIRYTVKNPFERFPDGRPKVPDSLLEKAKALSSEQIWALLPGAGYNNQFEGGWQIE